VQVYVRNATLVTQADGTRYAFYGAYSKTLQSELLHGRFTGTAVCADGALSHLLLSVDADSCDADASIAQWFCQAAPTYYAGVYAYGLYGGAHMEINGYGAAQWPFLFECVSETTCGSTLACNSSVNLENNYYQEGGVSIFNGTGPLTVSIYNSSVYANNTRTINIDNSFNYTIEAPALEEIFTMNSTTNVDTEGGSINIYAQNVTSSSCGGVAFFVGAELANQSLPSDGSSLTQLLFTSPAVPGFAQFTSDWQVLPIIGNAWQYTGASGVLYEVSVCLANAVALYGNGNDTYRLGLAIEVNGDAIDSAYFASTAFSLSRYTSPSASIDTLCTDAMLLANSSDVITAVMLVESLVLGTSTILKIGTRADLPPYAITFQAWPVSCEQRPNINQNNFTLNVTLDGNNTLIPGKCIYFEYSMPNQITINAELCQEDSDTIACTPKNVTTGKSKCRVVGPLANLTTECGVYCDEEGTFHANKLCSEEPQCEIAADPPETEASPSRTYTPRLCFTCGASLGFPNGGDGSGGGSSGGIGAPGSLPLAPPLLPPAVGGISGFFQPYVPGFTTIGGAGPGGSGTGTSSSGGPPSPLPIVTELNPGSIGDPTVTKGMKIPLVNFTAQVPFCGAGSHGQEVLEIGTLPETRYVCQILFNGTYAWVPDCSCIGSASNATIMHLLTLLSLNQSSTLMGDATSQLIWLGSTYLQKLLAQDLSLPLTDRSNVPEIDDNRAHIYAVDGGPNLYICVNDTCYIMRSYGFSNTPDISFSVVGNTVSASLTPTFAAGTYGPLADTTYDGKGRLTSGRNVTSLDNLQINDTLRLNKLAGINGAQVTVPDGLDVQAPSVFQAEARFNGPFEVETVPMFNAGGVVLSVGSTDNRTLGIGGTAANPILSFNRSSVVQSISVGDAHLTLSGTATNPILTAPPAIIDNGNVLGIAQITFPLNFYYVATFGIPPIYGGVDVVVGGNARRNLLRAYGQFVFNGYTSGATPFTEYNAIEAYIPIHPVYPNAAGYACILESWQAPQTVKVTGVYAHYPIDDIFQPTPYINQSVRIRWQFQDPVLGINLQDEEDRYPFVFEFALVPYGV
jgi:hypothetical protein